MVSIRACGWAEPKMRVLKDIVPIVVSLALMLAVTVILWHIHVTTGGSHHLVYVYLFPVALIAGLYNGRIALFWALLALPCADYFFQEPTYSLLNDDPREYGDLVWFALLAATGIKFIRVLVGPAQNLREEH
jgi:K+-sensing histidine kinase KdpD